MSSNDKKTNVKLGIWQLYITLQDGTRRIYGEFHGRKDVGEAWMANMCAKNNFRNPELVRQ